MIKMTKEREKQLEAWVMNFQKKNPKTVENIFRTVNFLGTLAGIFYFFRNIIPQKRYQPVQTKHRMVPKNRLRKKYEFYLSEFKKQQDASGFILTNECDAVLFSGLAGTAKGVEVYLEDAKDYKNQWFRRPLTTYDQCYPNHSKSTISRDMFIGIFWYIWRHKRLDLAEGVWKYGEENYWIMGQGDPSRIFMTPSMKALLAEIIYKLGGPNYRIARSVPSPRAKNKGYAAHLDMLAIGLEGEVYGGITEADRDLIIYHCETSPRNTYFKYLKGKYITGLYDDSGLHNERLFPEDRLPTRADRKEPWIWQRDAGSDWVADDMHWRHHEVHPGGDFLFVASLILEEFPSYT